MSAFGPGDGFLANVGCSMGWYGELADRAADWYQRNESTIRRGLEAGMRAYESFPLALALASVTFARGGWSEVPLGEMDAADLTELVGRLHDKPDEEVTRELDAVILAHFGRDDHEHLKKMVAGWRERFGGRQHIFEDALFAHKQGLFTLSIPTLAAQVEGVLRDLTREYEGGNQWIERFNDAFGFYYDRDPQRRPPLPAFGEIMEEFASLPAQERYQRAEELEREFVLLRVNELYDRGDFSDPVYTSSVRRHAILHGVFRNFGELESLRLFFLLELLHTVVNKYKERVWLVEVSSSHLPVLQDWHAEGSGFGRGLTVFYAENDGWVREVAEREERHGWIAFSGGEPAGFADLGIDKDEGLAYPTLYVAPVFRGRGVGTRMARLVARKATLLGLSGLVATVERGDEAGARCLAQAGFTRSDDSKDEETCLLLRLGARG